jgi:phage replication initiation protein
MFRPSAVEVSSTLTAQQSCAARYELASALIDWLSFSVIPAGGNTLDWIDFVLEDLFGIKRAEWKPTGRGWFGYSCRVDLGEWGLLAYGGERQRGTVHVELNAHACARILDWSRVQAFGESSGAWITRIDLAHDDFSGEVANIPRMLAWHRDGGFTTAGRPPKANLRDDLGSNDGKTFYVGNRKHGKTLRGYEKGKQLGDPTDPWFRIEAELHNKGRVIPWDVLSEPGRYFAGAYPCLATFNGPQSRIATNRRAATLTYKRMERWVGDAAGKALNVMFEANDHDAERMLRKVIRPGKPKRLAGYKAADFDSQERDQ